ncbi:hypothetical protein [Granulicatella sp. WM01]|uniref:hypothetical protein n=1 Tax=Granulicatella sp. WM01 TaxID=2558277 RepID=UPI001FD844BF|nr:hypothetical protein [Granulicatella sp. WM01]
MREQWEDIDVCERYGWYIAEKERLRVNAEDVIAKIIYDMDCDGYEDMEAILWDQIAQDDIDRVQNVLDSIFDIESADVYYQTNKKIDVI